MISCWCLVRYPRLWMADSVIRSGFHAPVKYSMGYSIICSSGRLSIFIYSPFLTQIQPAVTIMTRAKKKNNKKKTTLKESFICLIWFTLYGLHLGISTYVNVFPILTHQDKFAMFKLKQRAKVCIGATVCMIYIGYQGVPLYPLIPWLCKDRDGKCSAAVHIRTNTTLERKKNRVTTESYSLHYTNYIYFPSLMDSLKMLKGLGALQMDCEILLHHSRWCVVC